jgi:hypothetical protein
MILPIQDNSAWSYQLRIPEHDLTSSENQRMILPIQGPSAWSYQFRIPEHDPPPPPPLVTFSTTRSVQYKILQLHKSLTEQQWHIERKQNNEFYSMYHPIWLINYSIF